MSLRPSAHRLRVPSIALACVLLALSACGEGPAGPDVLAVEISPNPGLAVGVGSTVLFSATLVDVEGRVTLASSVDWSVADASIATIEASGLASARSEGTTTVTTSVDGVTASASLEVFIPERVSEYLPGTSYFGRNGYVEYIPGELPVVLSAPHGGTLTPDEIPNRAYGTFGRDLNTEELTRAVRDAFIDATGHAPHVVISHLHRGKLDPNREVVEAAQGSAFAERAWAEFQGFIETARTGVIGDFGAGMYFDMHGHGHEKNRLELGYLLSSERLNGSDASLNALSVVQLTSIREIGRTRPDTFAEVLRGATSLGGFLEVEGVPAVPSPVDPRPLDDAYFTGGYNTWRHGSLGDSEMISGIQIEHHFPGIRDSDENRRVYSARLATAIRAFMLEHFGFFEPAP